MKQIGFKNFRRFANLHTLDLGDVNLLVGGNNSGKSTVVKALLLITENLRMLLRDSDYDNCKLLNRFENSFKMDVAGNMHRLLTNKKKLV